MKALTLLLIGAVFIALVGTSGAQGQPSCEDQRDQAQLSGGQASAEAAALRYQLRQVQIAVVGAGCRMGPEKTASMCVSELLAKIPAPEAKDKAPAEVKK